MWAELDALMEAEGICEADVWDAGEITPIEPTLPMELTNKVPGLERALVCGDPFRLGEVLDYQQGFDNPYGAFGTCGLTSIANICKMAGMDVSEPEVVQYAMEYGQCIKDDPMFGGGGTTIGNDLEILSHFGVEGALRILRCCGLRAPGPGCRGRPRRDRGAQFRPSAGPPLEGRKRRRRDRRKPRRMLDGNTRYLRVGNWRGFTCATVPPKGRTGARSLSRWTKWKNAIPK